MAEDFAAISGIADLAQIRFALVQGKKIVHTPAVGLGQVLLGLDATPGIVVQTATAFTKRTLAAGNGIAITNPAGTVGDPSFALAAGTVVNRAYVEYLTNAALTTATPIDDTIPQVGEGTEILSVALTPKTTTNRIRARFTGAGSLSVAGNTLTAHMHVNAGANAVRATTVSSPNINYVMNLAMEYEYVPGATSAQTISVRIGPNAGTARMNGTAAARLLGGVMGCVLTLEEIVA